MKPLKTLHTVQERSFWPVSQFFVDTEQKLTLMLNINFRGRMGYANFTVAKHLHLDHFEFKCNSEYSCKMSIK